MSPRSLAGAAQRAQAAQAVSTDDARASHVGGGHGTVGTIRISRCPLTSSAWQAERGIAAAHGRLAVRQHGAAERQREPINFSNISANREYIFDSRSKIRCKQVMNTNDAFVAAPDG